MDGIGATCMAMGDKVKAISASIINVKVVGWGVQAGGIKG